jgi:glycosyltransferase involved in cell wall biosynthesis
MYACALIRKRYIVRTGGDFLWESYVERTGDMVLFRDFYDSRIDKLSSKERLVFRLTKKVLKKAKAIAFSTDWQRRIFEKAYGLDQKKDFIVENFRAGQIQRDSECNFSERIFIAGSRSIKIKNIDRLQNAFDKARKIVKQKGLGDIKLDLSKAMYSNFVTKIRSAYAVILPSLSEISPNMILYTIQAGVPFIVTKEIGIKDSVSSVAIFIDPLNTDDIVEKIVWISDPGNRSLQADKIANFHFREHSWADIGSEIIDIYSNKVSPK